MDIYEAYKTWPQDIRAKLSLHDLRRMNGWVPRPGVGDWRIDTSTPSPILTYQRCSVIQDEQARYVMGLLSGAGAERDTAWMLLEEAMECMNANDPKNAQRLREKWGLHVMPNTQVERQP